ncbi:enoyl-CoA hydratase/carnithine racemase [Bacillus mesophilus]|uniref:Ethylmalonyl-CoA decarboxylase n=1 Tax=Bacillus mesophilus TaxID=1808955 RepID=A0A6M0Q258_9BACI|nr:enoyl-CoA hydratase/isomerase family protein [Bacillus mesophilus]MBM7659474.1 enoyl-CoA hydratase/carnithine racemase [Bacillus mesophilus]NEY70347.1 enoyl-CoA hydratase/isomerase family protein [Bacillus mesophilus]
MTKTSVEKTESGVVILTIQRPSVRNAIDYDVMDQLNNIVEELSVDISSKALIITGEGEQAFCSGGDLSVFHELHTEEEAYFMLSKMGEILFKLMTLKKPTVALMNGIAIGGGLELATACDFRIARTNTKFGFVQGRLGITTGWGGGSYLFEKLPYDQAAKLLYSANMASVEYGQQIGFIQHLIEEDNHREAGIKWVVDLVRNSDSLVLAAYKEMVIRKWETTQLKQRVIKEIEQCSKLWALPAHHEAVNRFLSKEKN